MPDMNDTTKATSRDTGIRVLQAEAEALSHMAAALPEGFERAVEMILEAKGRVIVAGIGKSGHIARKIAATLASTGTPADFLHAAEASHGDLGMVTGEDVCILISRSGETTELNDLLLYTRRFSVPMIAISSKPDSTLMQAADCALALPDLPEACGIGLAPTTSTTLSLALGDALAVAVMDARGFSAEDFQTYHPGGKLGAQLMKVHELMHRDEALPLCAPEDAMTDVLLTMTSKRFGIAVVVDQDQRLVGVISDGDLRRNIAGLMDLRAGDITTRNPVTVTPDMLAAKALALVNAQEISVLPVVDAQNRPVGVLHIHDLLRAGVA
jgi:arabinose-5-phosphate isomerase